MIVYWVKRSGMTDPEREGYIGVTTKSLEERLSWHAKYNKKRSRVRKAIDKYNDIEIVEISKGNKTQCLKLEEKFRPEDGIGWNIVKGGGLPPLMSKKTASKISKTLKGHTRSVESRQKQSKTLMGQKWYCDPVNMVSRKYPANEQPDGWVLGMAKTNRN